jgi:hypothetical protein
MLCPEKGPEMGLGRCGHFPGKTARRGGTGRAERRRLSLSAIAMIFVGTLWCASRIGRSGQISAQGADRATGGSGVRTRRTDRVQSERAEGD